MATQGLKNQFPSELQTLEAFRDETGLPHFKFIEPRVTTGHGGVIAVGDDIFHRIDNLGTFYAALGFDSRIHRSILPAEFIWDRYVRSGSAKSEACLQIQIAAYLFRHSDKFVQQYGRIYESMTGKCASSDADRHCLQCPLHPPTGQ